MIRQFRAGTLSLKRKLCITIISQSLEEYIELVKEWMKFYNTSRIKGKKVNKKKQYNKNDK